MSELTVHAGQRIRLYRRAKDLTLEQLAALIHKSKSAVAKYEKGDISIDVDTLYEIAAALHVNPSQLLDLPAKPSAGEKLPNGFFSNASRFYMYYLNKNSTRIVCGVLCVHTDAAARYRTTLYSDVRDYENLYRCRHLYDGDIQYSDSYVNLVMQNQNNRAERVFLNIANPFSQSTATVGIISGTSAKYMVPISLKFILSQQQLPENEALLKSLEFTKEDFKLMRQTHCFSIDRLYEAFD